MTPYYDPMIAKIIAHGADRAAALERLAAALDATQVEGVTTNLAFLRAAAGQPRVQGDAAGHGLARPRGHAVPGRRPARRPGHAAAGRAGDRGAQPRPAGPAAGAGHRLDLALAPARRLAAQPAAARLGPAARRQGAAHRHRRGHGRALHRAAGRGRAARPLRRRRRSGLGRERRAAPQLPGRDRRPHADPHARRPPPHAGAGGRPLRRARRGGGQRPVHRPDAGQGDQAAGGRRATG